MGAGASSTSKTAVAASPSPPSAAQFARAISDADQRKDDAFMRKVFNRYATKEKLPASSLIAALRDIAAPVLVSSSTNDPSEVVDHVCRRASASTSGDVIFSE
jgi:predicted NAD-dependent protein-ADP-ribosyltransferase YbiA (DUF1768 family)